MAISVNGEFIDPAEIIAEADRLRPHYQEHVEQADSDEGETQLMEWARENVIERTLLQQKAMADETPLDEEEILAEIEHIRPKAPEDVTETQIREHVVFQMRIGRFMNSIIENAKPVTETDCKEFYDNNLDQFVQPEQIRASHIIKHVDTHVEETVAKEAIEAVKAELDGGKSFEELASEHSDCPDSAGDLGYFPRGHMVQEFEDVVFNMNVDEVSDIFRTPFGFHIAKVTDKQAEQPVAFEDVSEQVQEFLADHSRQEAVEAYVDKLKETAVIVDTGDAPAEQPEA